MARNKAPIRVIFCSIIFFAMEEAVKKTRPIFDRPNVLVAGGAGFLGSWLCGELVKTKKVICVDNFSTGKPENIEFLLQDPNFVFIKHDLAQPLVFEHMPEVQRFQVQFQGVQEIYNLACPTITENYESHAITTALANSLVVYNLLELAKANEARFLHASSAAVYGNASLEQDPITEDVIGLVDPLGERATYSEGKRFAETLVSTYARVEGINAKIVRIFNVYGPRTKPGAGRLIPDFVHQALAQQPIIVYGSEETRSSFCYALDAVDAMMRVMATKDFVCLNIGSPVGVPIAEVVQEIIKFVGSDSQIVFKPLPVGMHVPQIPNIAKIKTLLDWFPLTPLDQGLRATVDDVVSHTGLVGFSS